MRVLLTGATGFTGGYLATALLDRGHRVRALVRDPSRAQWLKEKGAELVRGDVRDLDAVRGATRGVKVVYHVAAAYREGGRGRNYYFDVNLLGTQNVVRSCLDQGVDRLVHCSTVGVHGEIERPPADEDAAMRPSDDYQRSKAAAEEAVWDGWREGRQRGLTEMVVVRPTGIYGPGDTRLLKFFRMVVTGKPIPGDGSVLYHLTYVTDVVNGMMLCAEHPEAPGEAFILAGPSWCTLREWAEEIVRQAGTSAPKFGLPTGPISLAASVCEGLCLPLGLRPPLHRRSLDFFTKDRAFTWKKARKKLGYHPAVSMADGVRNTLQWYRKRGFL